MIRRIITTLVVSILFGHATFAQEVEVAQSQRQQEIFTSEQRGMLKAQKDAVKQNRKQFKASLSDEQLVIFENKELSRKERREALRVTLTDFQKQFLTANRKKIKAMKDAFRATITNEQKRALKKRRKQRMKQRE